MASTRLIVQPPELQWRLHTIRAGLTAVTRMMPSFLPLRTTRSVAYAPAVGITCVHARRTLYSRDLPADPTLIHAIPVGPLPFTATGVGLCMSEHRCRLLQVPRHGVG